MSAAATAAGYLYASGRLRGRNSKEGETQEPEQKARPRRQLNVGQLKVAVYDPRQDETLAEPVAVASQPRVAPRIQYRTRRWKPE